MSRWNSPLLAAILAAVAIGASAQPATPSAKPQATPQTAMPMGMAVCGVACGLADGVAGWAEAPIATAARMAARRGEFQRDMLISFRGWTLARGPEQAWNVERQPGGVLTCTPCSHSRNRPWSAR